MATVVIFGGTGFLGLRTVERLATDGATVRVAVRHPDQARSILRAAGLHDVTVFGADVRDQPLLPPLLPGPTPSSTRSRPMSRKVA